MDFDIIRPDFAIATDEELLNQWFEGEILAFECFFKRHSARVYGYGLKNGISSNDMEDVVQEVFIRLHSSIHNYERGRAALPWFFTIVHHTCVDWVRKVSSKKYNHINLDGLDEKSYLNSHKQYENQSTNEKISELETCLASLNEKEKELFQSRHVEDLSFKEISLKTGKTAVSLRKTYQRMIETLKKMIVRN